MSDKTSTNREALIKITNLVRPALSTQNYIPALMTIRFDGETATAYNDISAISVKADVEVEECLPGELLIKALGSFSADKIMFQEGPDASIVVSSGRSKIKIPTQEIKNFPFEWPAVGKKDHGIELDDAVLKGIGMCLLSVGTDPTHPAQMGVTLDLDTKGNAVLFSTDNFTISRYQTKAKCELPGDAPVILPRFFCEQLITLAKAFPKEAVTLYLISGALMVTFGNEAKLFTKTPVDLEPLDFPKIIDKHCKLAGLKGQLGKIPDNFDSALSRALLVLSSETDKVTKVTLVEDEARMESTSSMGEAIDSITLDSGTDDEPTEPVHIDPSLVARAAKVCTMIGFTKKVLIMTDEEAQFIHLVAYCAAA